MRRLVALAVALPLALAACQIKPPPSTPDRPEGPVVTGPARHILLRLEDGRDPSEERVLRELSATAGLNLHYVRPMAGGAHVLGADGTVTEAELDRAVDRLARQQGVRYTSRDRMKQHQ